LKYIEVDLAISNVLEGSFSAGTKRKLPDKIYKDRAMRALGALRFPASASTPSAVSGNTGDGTVSAITINDDFTLTEIWTLTALSSQWFRVEGTRTKDLPDCEMGVDYPDKTLINTFGSDYGRKDLRLGISYTDYPIRFKITEGATPFAQYDMFTFKTFSSTRKKRGSGKVILG